MKIKKEDISKGPGISEKSDSTCPAANKVLPMTNLKFRASENTNDQCGTSNRKSKLKGDKAKTISRMKELIRWAVNAKSLKGSKFIGPKVLRNRGAVKAAAPDNDQLINESPKVSFRWDMESCYSVTSACSAISMPSTLKTDQAGHAKSLNSTPVHNKDLIVRKKGNWINTDSEFVVLEL